MRREAFVQFLADRRLTGVPFASLPNVMSSFLPRCFPSTIRGAWRTAACLLLLALPACRPSAPASVDSPDLSAAFASATEEVRTTVAEASRALGEGQLFEGATHLAEAITQAESLTEAQKAALRNTADRIKLSLAKEGPRADLKVFETVQRLLAALGDPPPKSGTPSL